MTLIIKVCSGLINALLYTSIIDLFPNGNRGEQGQSKINKLNSKLNTGLLPGHPVPIDEAGCFIKRNIPGSIEGKLSRPHLCINVALNN